MRSWATSPAARASMRGNASGGTRPELRLRAALRRLGVRGYRVNHPLPLPGLRRSADVSWPGRRVAVFVDGRFWHDPRRRPPGGPNAAYWAEKLRRNVERDRETNALLARAGWLVVRVWDDDDMAKAAEWVRALLPGPPHGAARAAVGRFRR